MKETRSKKETKNFRLPQISSKTSSSFSTQQNSDSRIRPSSSSKVNELQKNLFAQLDQYDGMSKKGCKKSKTRKQIQISTPKGDPADFLQIQAPYLKKLEKLMPDTYNKLIAANKLQPLQQSNTQKLKSTTSQRLDTNISKSLSTQSKKKGTKGKQQKRQSSFTVAERQVQAIYQRYLQEQGMTDFKQYKSQDLQQLNKQINHTQSQINELRKSYYNLINQFSVDCLEQS